MPITTLTSIISTLASDHENHEEHKEQSPRFSLTIHIPLDSELTINYIVPSVPKASDILFEW
jgi:hypothetical protein